MGTFWSEATKPHFWQTSLSQSTTTDKLARITHHCGAGQQYKKKV